MWDTFRAFNPLKTILDPDRTNDFVQTLLHKYDEGGTLPMWELVGNYTGCMIGYHSVPVIVDAYFKGIRDFDVEKAYQAMVEAATYDTIAILFPSKDVQEDLMPKGKLYNETLDLSRADLENKSVSKALEYAYNDWCIAQMARDLGKTEDYNRFMERSKRYALYFDKGTQDQGIIRFFSTVLNAGYFRLRCTYNFSKFRLCHSLALSGNSKHLAGLLKKNI